jgi:hypothetical protein
MPGSPGTPPPADPAAGARLALVIATGAYSDAGLRRLGAPAKDAADLAQVLADPAIGGFTVTTVLNKTVHETRVAVEDFLHGRSTRDLLLVYLSCHGLLDARRRLYFAAADTRMDRLGSTGIESAWLLDQLEDCRARRQVLILDSCFSGAFAHGAKGESGLDLEDRLLGQGRGRVVLTASTAIEHSFEGRPTSTASTAGSVFTAALVQGLRTGEADGDGDGHVSIDDAYGYVFDRVKAAGAAQTPQRWLYGGEGAIVLARSPLGSSKAPASPQAAGRAPANADPDAPVGTSPSPARQQARALLADAEYLARTISRPDMQAEALIDTAEVLARIDPPAAERLARTITAPHLHHQAIALANTAKALTGQAPAEARRLLADARKITNSISDNKYKQVLALDAIAEALAELDPAAAEQIPASVFGSYLLLGRDPEYYCRVLASAARGAARRNPDEARRLLAEAEKHGSRIVSPLGRFEPTKAAVLLRAAQVAAELDPSDAVRIAGTIGDPVSGAQALASAATATGNPAEAARLLADAEQLINSNAESFSVRQPIGRDEQASGLAAIARIVAGWNPAEARRLLADAEKIASLISHSDRLRVLRNIVPVLVTLDPPAAERIARGIANPPGQALSWVAEKLAEKDPADAERIARTIENPDYQASALSRIAIARAVQMLQKPADAGKQS